jgi:hypothetical protein
MIVFLLRENDRRRDSGHAHKYPYVLEHDSVPEPGMYELKSSYSVGTRFIASEQLFFFRGMAEKIETLPAQFLGPVTIEVFANEF